MILFKRYSSIVFLLIMLLSCSKEESNNNIPIKGWQVLYSQTEDISLVELTEHWENLDLNEAIALPYKKNNSYQYIWLKGDFFNNNTENISGISFENISLVHRVFINDNIIGSLEVNEVRDLGGPRNYYIPPSLIRYGPNSIYLRVGVYDQWSIEVSKNIFLQDSPAIKKTKLEYNLKSEITPLSVLTILIGTFFSFLIKSFNEKWNKEYLLLSVRLFLLVICFLTFYSPIPLYSINVVIAIWSGIIPLFCICMFIYPQIVFSIYLDKINKVITPLLLTSSIIIYILKVNYMNIFLNNVLLIFSVSISIFLIIYILIKIIRNRDRSYNLVLITADTIIVIFNIVIISYFLIANEYILDPSLIVTISSLLLTILYLFYFTRRDSLRKFKMLSLLTRIKEIESKSKESKKYNISPQLAEKLDKVILFIEQNYFQIVSREELADTVGVTPNYLSSLFNIYTGKKINEFINDIRLEHASKKIKESKLSITDIAFSSGFESLTTFNRLFKKKFNSSPKKYRQI